MIKKAIFNLFIITALLACNVKNQSYQDIFFNHIKTGSFNGNVLVFEKGKTVLKEAYGVANIHNGDSLALNSIFRLGSVSKQFTAMAIAILKDDGKLSYNQDLKEFMPEFPYEGITVKHLLQHTSGLPDYLDLMIENWKPEYKEDDPLRYISGNEDIIQMLIEKTPKVLFQPGKKWEYSNTGYIMLATIVELVSGKSFKEFLSERIFKPIGMANSSVYTYMKEEDPSMPKRVFGFMDTEDGRISNDVHFLNFAKGDGGVYSTLEDLLKWDRALNGNQLVSESTLKEVFMNGTLDNGESTGYGFGWFIRDAKHNNKIAYHGGGWVGFGTYIYRDISNDSFFVILTNNSKWDEVKDLVEGFRQLMSR